MTDFYTRLEDQLVDAGARRASRGSARRAIAGRRPQLLAAAAVIAVLIAAVALLPPLISSSDSGPSTPSPKPNTPAEVVSLKGVSVSVLNATTTPGRARDAATRLEALGARIAFVGDGSDQALEHSVIRFKARTDPQARKVAYALGIARMGMGDHEAQTTPGQVVVYIGADGFRPPPVNTPIRVYTNARIAQLVSARVSELRGVRCVPARGSISWNCTGRVDHRPWTCVAGVSKISPASDPLVSCGPVRR